MKQFVALTLSTLVLCISSEGYQLFKLPMLLAHFAEHHRTQPQASFSSLLVDHYSAESPASHDGDDDSSLPYKHDDCEYVADLSSALPVIRCTTTRLLLVSTPLQHVHDLLIEQILGSDIFEPPRTV